MAEGLVLLIPAATALILGVLWIRARHRAKRLERESATLRRDLEHARDAKDTFFNLVTHELRAPLASILGYQELLHDGAFGRLDEPAMQPIERIGRSGRHLLHLIDGVVELGRLRSGPVRLGVQAVELGPIFAATADSFRTAARERGIDPRVHMPASLPTIRSDPDHLLRALDLLVTSATRYPEDSELTLEITADGDGVTTRLAGIGIELRQDSDDPVLRMGIRLAVAEAAARALGGALELETDEQGLVRALSFRVRDLTDSKDTKGKA